MAYRVQHSDLPDNLLHEPKGAATAVANTVYVADGAGSGSFKNIEFKDVIFDKGTEEDITHSPIDSPLQIHDAGLRRIADRSMADVSTGGTLTSVELNAINKNFKELYDYTQSCNSSVIQVAEAVSNLEQKINSLLSTLREIGILEDNE